MQLFGVVLAGGGARRLGGRDKALAPLAGRPLLGHVLGRFAPQVGPLVLSANGDPRRFAPFGLDVVADHGGHGPLAGVLAALSWAGRLGAGPDDCLISVSVDTPFVPCDLAAQLYLGGQGRLAMACAGGRVHPTCALWPCTTGAALAQFVGGGGARMLDFMAQQGAVEVPFADANCFFNLNSPDDFMQAETMLRQ